MIFRITCARGHRARWSAKRRTYIHTEGAGCNCREFVSRQVSA